MGMTMIHPTLLEAAKRSQVDIWFLEQTMVQAIAITFYALASPLVWHKDGVAQDCQT